MSAIGGVAVREDLPDSEGKAGFGDKVVGKMQKVSPVRPHVFEP